MYRPQFAFPKPPAGCEDQRCLYSFDGSNTPMLSGSLGGNLTLNKIPLLLDRDAPFLLRAIQVSATALLVGIEDPGGHTLVYPTSLGLPPTISNPLWAQCDGGINVPLESDDWGIYCRAGSALIAYVQNGTGGSLTLPIITLHGVKRFTGVKCR